MYLIRFHGGLGNQMFEYTFYCFFKNRLKERGIDTALLKADLTWFDRNWQEHQGYELKRVFGIELPAATYEEVAKVHEYYPRYYKFAGFRYLSRQIAKRKNAKRPMPEGHIFNFGPEQYVYDPQFENLDPEKDWYIEGVFCSDAYLKYCETEVRKNLTFAQPMDAEDAATAEGMRQQDSVAVHVRRGDYVGNVFDILGTEYYERAAEKIRETVKEPVFYVFSDDVEYIRQNFAFLGDYRMIHHSGKDSYRDMQMMAECRHMIIANSSFSYWGAVLGEKEGSVIVAPKQYKADEQLALARDNWIKL